MPQPVTASTLIRVYQERIRRNRPGPRLTAPLQLSAAVPPSEKEKTVSEAKTKTVLTDELVKETYDQLYIGQSTSLNRCAEILDVAPYQLKSHWKGLGLRLRDPHESRRARDLQGHPWQWETPETEADTPLAEALDLTIPDSDGKGYQNGHLTPGPGRRAIPITPAADLDATAAETVVETGQPIAFQVKEGVVYDVERKPAETVPNYLGDTIVELYPREIARRLNMILREEFNGAAVANIESISFSVKVTVPVNRQ